MKQMVRRCTDSADSDYKDLGRSIVGVAFLGTPHQGTALASSLDQLLRRFLSKQVQRLKKRKLALRDRMSFLDDQLTPDIIA